MTANGIAMHIEIAEDIAPETAETLKILVKKYHKIHIAGPIKLAVNYSEDNLCAGCGQKCDSESYFAEDSDESPIYDIKERFILFCTSCDCGYTCVNNIGSGALFRADGTGTATCNFWDEDGARCKINIQPDKTAEIMETKLIEIQGMG